LGDGTLKDAELHDPDEIAAFAKIGYIDPKGEEADDVGRFFRQNPAAFELVGLGGFLGVVGFGYFAVLQFLKQIPFLVREFALVLVEEWQKVHQLASRGQFYFRLLFRRVLRVGCFDIPRESDGCHHHESDQDSMVHLNSPLA
jgi:hypothetical protein